MEVEEFAKKQGGRWVVDGLVGRDVCEELLFIHRSNAVVGNRDRFSVTTLRQPLANFDNWGHLIPLLRLRGRSRHSLLLVPPTALSTALLGIGSDRGCTDELRNAVEELSGELFALFIEWTGVSCWHAGSSIPMHYDRSVLLPAFFRVIVAVVLMYGNGWFSNALGNTSQ